MDRVELNWGELPFDYVETDCHLVYRYRDGGWDEGEVVEGSEVTIPIASTCLHYGQECFEGMKAFETKDGRVLTFRPDQNATRMKNTAERLMMPALSEDDFVAAIDKVVGLNRRFIPPYGSGASLYIRPLLMGITGTVGIKPSREYMFLVFVTPVGPYFKSGLKPIKLRVEEEFDRAAPNGLGHVKASGNYAAGLMPSFQAKSEGYDEVLYLDPREKNYIDESGAANFFAITKDNVFVTPRSESILPSVTNASIMQLARDLGMTVERRPIHVEELFEFAEAGAVGTAAIIAPVERINYRGKDIVYLDGQDIGPQSKKLYDRLTGIQCGDVEDTHGWTRAVPLD